MALIPKAFMLTTSALHGADDTLLPPPHGEHTAALIEGSKLVILQGMGHNMPKEIAPDLLKNMIEHMEAVKK
jgi:pimeloyl-ACP methyl ester carboxylesterase|tara:strand:- start:72 stop:287 length:216 start_codon:yes stop_codon:yes gene_type:complete